MHCLAFGVDRLATASRVLAPVRDKASAQRVEGHNASVVIAPDHQQVLARRGIPSGRIVMRAAVADIHPFDDAIA